MTIECKKLWEDSRRAGLAASCSKLQQAENRAAGDL